MFLSIERHARTMMSSRGGRNLMSVHHFVASLILVAGLLIYPPDVAGLSIGEGGINASSYHVVVVRVVGAVQRCMRAVQSLFICLS